MNKIIVLVGVAGCGKSTYTKQYIKDNNLNSDVWVSSDNIRGEFRNQNIEFNNEKVFSEMYSRVLSLTKSGVETVIYDATNLSRKFRIHLYRNLKAHFKGYSVQIVLILKPLKHLLADNATRQGIARVPDEVIHRMYRQLEIPKIGLDCDSCTIQVTHDYSEFEAEYIDSLDIEQTSKYHKETLREHLELCKKNLKLERGLISKAEYDKLELITEYHDYGKVLCRGGEAGSYNFYNHEKVSAMYYLAKFKSLDEILEVIYQHINGHSIVNGKININKFRNKHHITDSELSLIIKFQMIDSKSRIE